MPPMKPNISSFPSIHLSVTDNVYVLASKLCCRWSLKNAQQTVNDQQLIVLARFYQWYHRGFIPFFFLHPERRKWSPSIEQALNFRAESVEEMFLHKVMLRQYPPVDSSASRDSNGNLSLARPELSIKDVQPNTAPVAATSGDTYSESPISTGRLSLSYEV